MWLVSDPPTVHTMSMTTEAAMYGFKKDQHRRRYLPLGSLSVFFSFASSSLFLLPFMVVKSTLKHLSSNFPLHHTDKRERERETEGSKNKKHKMME